MLRDATAHRAHINPEELVPQTQDKKTAELKKLVKKLAADATRTAQETHRALVKQAAEAAVAAAADVESQLAGHGDGGAGALWD